MRFLVHILLLQSLVAVAHANSCECSAPIPSAGLLVDLDADKGALLETNPEIAGEGHKEGEVAVWANQADEAKLNEFTNFRPGGRPSLRTNIAEIGGHSAIVFTEDELVNGDADALDHLTTGSGFTWAFVLAAHAQHPTRASYHNVNAFFGNLKNGAEYEGFWAGLHDDNTLFIGSRNSLSFGRWNGDNPKIVGPKLEVGRFYVIAGRMQSGRGAVLVELFVNDSKPFAVDTFVVVPDADPSKLAIGQERDATNHPGKESFDGEIARALIWERPLTNDELSAVVESLKSDYMISVD